MTIKIEALRDDWFKAFPFRNITDLGNGKSSLPCPINGVVFKLVVPTRALAPLSDAWVLIFNRMDDFVMYAPDGSPRSAPCSGKALLALLGEPTVPEQRPKGLSERAQYLKNMLADVKVEGRYEPMPHQYEAAAFKSSQPRAFDLSTMRTGKTGSTMLALEFLFRTGQIGRALVLSPLTCVTPVWLDALRDTLPNRSSFSVIGDKADRMKALALGGDILVTNYECVKNLYNEWLLYHPDVIIIDECTAYANMHSQRSKAIKKLINAVQPRYVWGMTGTPGHDPIKAFSMSKLVNPDAVNVRTESAWRDLTQYKYGPQVYMYKNRDCAPEMIKKALSPAVLFRKDQLFNLPPVVYTARQVMCSKDQLSALSRLHQDMMLVLEGGAATVTAVQKSALISKLMQIAAGSVIDDKSEIAHFEIKDRVDEICNLIEEATGKTVIFVPFTAVLNRLADELKERKYKVGVVDGSVSEKRRSEVFHDFQYVSKGQGPVDVLVAHPRTTAFGVELAAADMMIFNGPPMSGDFVFGQAVERMSSVKQKAKQLTIAQVYACSEERSLFRALMDGQSASQAVAALFDSLVS